MRAAAKWAGIAGAVGFLIGFVGPIVFSPEANQGPLLGIFITGPGGFLFGALLGVVPMGDPLRRRIVASCAAAGILAMAVIARLR